MKTKRRKLNFPVIIFLVSMLFTFLTWDHYFNSNRPFDQAFASNMILFMGTLFSIAAGLFVWSLEKSRDYLEATTFESMRRRHIAEGSYRKLRETHHRLVESEKLASIGRLLAGIVHDLKNPLITAIGYAEYLAEKKTGQEIEAALAIIKRQNEHCLKIVRDLLAFARQHKMEFQSADVCHLIDEIINSLPFEFNTADIEIIRNYPEPKPIVQADPDQLRRVFMNIIMNAWQALEGVRGDKKIRVDVCQSDSSVRLIFSDNGLGISEENLKKIFDPFFTTKKNGEGTGLGLSICYGIIQEHGGRITVQSGEGKGASFVIELPIGPDKTTSSGSEQFVLSDRVIANS